MRHDTPRSMVPAGAGSGLVDPDLDALVLAEIELLGPRAARRALLRPQAQAPRSRRAHPRDDRPVDLAPDDERDPLPAEGDLVEAAFEADAGLLQPRGPGHGDDGELYDAQGTNGLDDAGLGEDGDGGKRVDDRMSLLSTEEQAFVTRATGFLAQRPHADIILGCIWQQVADALPDGCFDDPPTARRGGPGSALPVARATETPARVSVAPARAVEPAARTTGTPE